MDVAVAVVVVVAANALTTALQRRCARAEGVCPRAEVPEGEQTV